MFKQPSLGAQGCADRALCRISPAHMHASRPLHGCHVCHFVALGMEGQVHD